MGQGVEREIGMRISFGGLDTGRKQNRDHWGSISGSSQMPEMVEALRSLWG